jgi:hypothetical protein
MELTSQHLLQHIKIATPINGKKQLTTPSSTMQQEAVIRSSNRQAITVTRGDQTEHIRISWLKNHASEVLNL